MRRLANAFREWLDLRARVHDERRFHLDQAKAAFRALGLSRLKARRAARRSFGAGRNRRAALRQIGGDIAGLVHLLRAHRVTASLWLQPVLLLTLVIVILVSSPSPRLLVESVIGRPLYSDAPHAVIFVAPAPWPLFSGISASEFEAIRSLPILTAVERDQTIYARAISRGASMAVIESRARARTGNPRIAVISEFDRDRIRMGPAMAIWIIAAGAAFRALRTHASDSGKARWLLYAVFNGCLHCLASFMTWAWAGQIWSSAVWPHLAASLSFSVILLAWLLLTVLQCWCWRQDLYRRCPVCLDGLVLASTQGHSGRVLLGTAVTESVCAHGHGILVESRWQRQFRGDESFLNGLLHA